MKKTYVRYSIDLDNPPPLTEEQKAEIAKLKAMPDEDIDYSDIPPLTDEFWQNAKSLHFRPIKSSTTVRVDSDILLWLKSQGKGYQTRINAILRSAMLEDKRNK